MHSVSLFFCVSTIYEYGVLLVYLLVSVTMVCTTPVFPGKSCYFVIFFQDPGKLLENGYFLCTPEIFLEFCEE